MILPLSQQVSPSTASLEQARSQDCGSGTVPKAEYDVVIVGGGIVGLMVACALRQTGLRIAVVEVNPNSVAIAKGQAYNLSPLSNCILQGVGAWDLMKDQVQPYRKIALSDADFPEVVQFSPEDLGVEPLGYVTEHQVLLSALLAIVQGSETIDWLCPACLANPQYENHRVVADLNIQEQRYPISAKLLIAADGVRSPLREQSGIKTIGWRYPQSRVVAFIQPEHPHQGIAYERFWPSGPFAILPLVNGQCRIVWTAPQAEAEALLSLSDDAFVQQLQTRYGEQMGQLHVVGRRFAFPVQLKQSQAYVQSRFALVGDAAHTCHPVGGQGLNLGIRDAAVLAEVIQEAHQLGQDLGDLKVLQRYERWRQRENWVMLAMTDFLVRMFSNQVWPLVILRRLGLRVMIRVPFLKQVVLRLMTGLTGRIPAIAKPFLQQWQKQDQNV